MRERGAAAANSGPGTSRSVYSRGTGWPGCIQGKTGVTRGNIYWQVPLPHLVLFLLLFHRLERVAIRLGLGAGGAERTLGPPAALRPHRLGLVRRLGLLWLSQPAGHTT